MQTITKCKPIPDEAHRSMTVRTYSLVASKIITGRVSRCCRYLVPVACYLIVPGLQSMRQDLESQAAADRADKYFTLEVVLGADSEALDPTAAGKPPINLALVSFKTGSSI